LRYVNARCIIIIIIIIIITTTTVLWPLYRSTSVSRHLQLEDFVGAMLEFSMTITYTVFHKKGDIILMVISLSNVKKILSLADSQSPVTLH